MILILQRHICIILFLFLDSMPTSTNQIVMNHIVMRHFKTAVVGATELEHVVASVIWRHHVLGLITSLMHSAASIHSFSYSWFGEVGGVLHRLWRCIIMNLRQPSLFFAFSVRTWDLLRLSQMSIIESAVSIFGVVRADVAVAD